MPVSTVPLARESDVAPARGAATVDRFVAFAFAAADLLIETDPLGRIIFATGAFRSRFGASEDSFLGSPITELFIPGDRPALTEALAAVAQRGRIAPLALNLSDRFGSASSVAALLMPADSNGPARLCFSIGPIAIRPAQVAASPDPHSARVRSPVEFARNAEQVLRSGQDGALNLLEIKGFAAAQPGASRAELQTRLERTLADAGPHIIAGHLGEGRFGVVSGPDADIGAALSRFETTLHDTPGGQTAQISRSAIDLDSGALTPGQAARALRYALGRFIEGGTDAAAAIGSGRGLAGIVAAANARAVGVRHAIAHRRFRLAYQPVVSLADRKTHHYEALLRPIPTPGSPTQSTQEFVTFAEAVGLSEDLDWAVLEEAITTLIARRSVSVAVNISGMSMQNPAFRSRLIDRIQALRTLPERPGARLLVELTETAEIEDMLGAASSIDALRAEGVPVCLDDFGAGSAALRYLRSFQVDFVKIDGVYVQGAEHNARDRSFVASIIEMAAASKAEVVAEMIETEQQARLMSEMGVGYGQGWLFGRPGVLPGNR